MTYDETHLRAQAEQVLDEAGRPYRTTRSALSPWSVTARRDASRHRAAAFVDSGGPVRQGERRRRNGLASRA
ncbi:hypothetical protein [Streptomyces sp. NPDC050164]|uniref:hypothetical protein n=1 Tax=Streptomyces sp. NPDC050164 TaxID=3365605 RepID=UPI0037A5BD62